MRALVVAAAVALVAVVAAVGLRRDALVHLSLAALPPLAVTWAAGFALMRAGWRDIDGWVDCYPHCHAWHYVGSVWFWGPPLAAFLLVLVVVGAAVRTAMTASAGGSRRGTRTRR